MQSRNPVFARSDALRRQPDWTPSPQHLEKMYDAPAYAPPTTRSMTIDDVVIRGFLTLGTLVLTGATAWVLNLGIGVAFVAMLVGVVLALVVSFKRQASPALILGFAACYGVAVGVISHVYNTYYHGVVLQAVVGTALAFAAMLMVYTLRIIRVTPKFVRFVIAAGLALVGLMVINLLLQVFGVDGGIGIRENGALGIAFSAIAILVGCFFLLLDFASIEEGVKAGAPVKFAWFCAFGLTLSLVWIYLEMLRLLSYFSGRE